MAPLKVKQLDLCETVLLAIKRLHPRCLGFECAVCSYFTRPIHEVGHSHYAEAHVNC